MLGSHSLGFVGEGMDFMGKREKNGEVPLQSLMIISFLFILPLSSSTFSTEIISFESQLDSLIFFIPILIENNSACWCQLNIPRVLMFLLLSFYHLHYNPENPSPFSFLIQTICLFNPGWLMPVPHTLPNPLDYNKFLNLCAVVLGSSLPMIFNSLA